MDWQVNDQIHRLKRNKRKAKSKPQTIVDIYDDSGHKMVAITTAKGKIGYMSYKGLDKYYRW